MPHHSKAGPGPERVEALSVEEAELRADCAKLDLVVAKARDEFGDDRLRLTDIAAIQGAAAAFGVTRLAAYRRAKELGLLSYQDLTTGAVR